MNKPTEHFYPREVIESFMVLMCLGVDHRNIALAGGYCRDIVHGDQPKDIDIIVVNDTGFTADDITALLPHWELQSVHSEYDGRPSGDFHERWEVVYQFKTPCMDVDILVAKPQFKHVAQSARMNDFNLNQYISTYRTVLGHGVPEYVGASPEGTLVRTELTKVDDARIERMRFKAKMFGWNV